MARTTAPGAGGPPSPNSSDAAIAHSPSTFTPLVAWPDVPSSYVLGVADPVVNPEWSRRVVPGVLGVQPIEIAAGHSPFLSAPVALVDVLER